jgi:TolA-binding protein
MIDLPDFNSPTPASPAARARGGAGKSSRKSLPLVAVADELVERLARLEEQMRQVLAAVERLSSRDAELDASLRSMAERFSAALDVQAETFRASLKDVTDRFVSRDDWMFWKSLLTAAMLALVAYGWAAMVGHSNN